MKMNNKKELENNGEKEMSFFQRMKTDKKYSAKIQLAGYGILLLVLVVYLNIAGMGSGTSDGNMVLDGLNGGTEVENTDKDTGSLLKSVDDNYSYDMSIEIKRKNVDTDVEEEFDVYYKGKAYGNQLEINKVVAAGNSLYYKVDDRYYSKSDNVVDFVKEDVVYDFIDREYIELDDILKLLDKASLDHVTDYSSGKKEYVYHLKVKDVIVSYQKEDVVEVEVEEENGVLKIEINYSNLFRVMDDNILECELEATITNIGMIEEFEVLNEGEENTSVE